MPDNNLYTLKPTGLQKISIQKRPGDTPEYLNELGMLVTQILRESPGLIRRKEIHINYTDNTYFDKDDDTTFNSHATLDKNGLGIFIENGLSNEETLKEIAHELEEANKVVREKYKEGYKRTREEYLEDEKIIIDRAERRVSIR